MDLSQHLVPGPGASPSHPPLLDYRPTKTSPQGLLPVTCHPLMALQCRDLEVARRGLCQHSRGRVAHVLGRAGRTQKRRSIRCLRFCLRAEPSARAGCPGEPRCLREGVGVGPQAALASALPPFLNSYRGLIGIQ